MAPFDPYNHVGAAQGTVRGIAAAQVGCAVSCAHETYVGHETYVCCGHVDMRVLLHGTFCFWVMVQR